ncbi:hypothetical protein IGI37_001655 [Enterococcus sp. AZ194]|uniref:hypothetical protein n=1 Tax=Enterococcus sp. AZ194 TaxID=2774629 RepID=UPI003F255DFF
MRSYSLYLLRSTFKNPLNYIPLLLPAIITIVLFCLNMSGSANTAYVHDLGRELSMGSAHLDRLNASLEDENLPDEEKKELEEIILLSENYQDKLHQALAYAQQGDWKNALAIQVELMEKFDLPAIGEIDVFAERIVKVDQDTERRLLMTTYKTYKELSKHNLEPDVNGQEKKGLSYMYRMMDSVYPIIFSLCLIAVLSSILCMSLIDKIDIEESFPKSALRLHLEKSAFLILFGFAFYCLFLFVPLLIAGVTDGIGSLNYPISRQSISDVELMSLGEVILRAGVLQLLAIIFLVMFVYLIATLTRSNLSTLFISTVVILGPVIATELFEPMQKIIHLLPTTYFHSVGIVTDRLTSINEQASFQMGILVLLVSSGVIYALIMYMKYSREKGQLFFKKI